MFEPDPCAEVASTPTYKEGSYFESNDHLIFRDGVTIGENVIKLDFTSPILTSGSAITRYVDKEDGAEYIYSLFVPSDASTAFPVFDQPDLKAKFTLNVVAPRQWKILSNENLTCMSVHEVVLGTRDGSNTFDPGLAKAHQSKETTGECSSRSFRRDQTVTSFPETKPISTYVFAFAAGPFEAFADTGGNASGSERELNATDAQAKNTLPTGRVSASKTKVELNEIYKRWLNNDCCGIFSKEETKSFKKQNQKPLQTSIYVRKSQAEKFKPHAAEVFRLNREGIKYLEQYFDYKFPFPKYDLVLIPEFPFGGMEHAGATFLKESSHYFPDRADKKRLHHAGQCHFSRSRASMVRRHGDDEMV